MHTDIKVMEIYSEWPCFFITFVVSERGVISLLFSILVKQRNYGVRHVSGWIGKEKLKTTCIFWTTYSGKICGSDGEKVNVLNVRGMAEGFSLSPIVFAVCIGDINKCLGR